MEGGIEFQMNEDRIINKGDWSCKTVGRIGSVVREGMLGSTNDWRNGKAPLTPSKHLGFNNQKQKFELIILNGDIKGFYSFNIVLSRKY